MIAFETFAGSGPELPMQVVQPKPTRLKPRASRSPCSPAFSKYSATICEPGASEVLTQGFVLRPFLTALRARRPAPIITLGFEVFVQEVMAAMTTSPWPRSKLASSTRTRRPISAALRNSFSMAPSKSAFDGVEGNAVLRPLRAGKRGLHVGKIEGKGVGEDRDRAS